MSEDIKKIILEEDVAIEAKPNNTRFVEAVYGNSGSIVFRGTNDESRSVSKSDLKVLLK